MPAKTKEQAAKERAVTAYRDVAQVFKTNLISDINRAITQGAIKLESETEGERLLSLLESLIDLHQANGHEQFTNINR